jgi:uncharacterized protein (TIRG00374 family)
VKLSGALSLGVLFAVAASAIAPFVLHGTRVLHDAAAFPAMGAAAIVCAVIAGWVGKAFKFRLLAARLGRSLPFLQCLAVSVGCDFAFVASPGGIAGYPATVLLFGRIGVEAPRALAVAAADQVLDLVFFGIAMPLALVWLLTLNMPTSPVLGPGVLAALAAAFALVLVGGVGHCGKTLSLLARRLSNPGWAKLRRLVSLDHHWQQLRCHLRDLYAAPAWTMAGLAFATVVQWLARYATLGIALAWTGHRIPCVTVFLGQAVALHAGQWTGVPGGVGATDAILLASLRPWLPLASLATALVVWRLATFHLTLLAGGGACIWLVVRDRRIQATHPAIAMKRS